MPPKIDLNEEVNRRVAKEFKYAIARGYTVTEGFVMQCDKEDYQSMNEGLALYLNTPVEKGGAGGDDQKIVIIRDKFNNANYQTIATGKEIALNMMKYYWSLWARKGAYRDNLAKCKTVAEMDSVIF